MADTSEKLPLTMAEAKPDADAVFGVPVLDDAVGSLAEDLGGGSVAASDVLCPATVLCPLVSCCLASGGGPLGSAFAECQLLPNSVSYADDPLMTDAECRVRSGLVSEAGSRIIIVNGGLVSEEVVVTPAARAALRPQPTDGLRQPPLSLVEPAVVERSGPGVLTDVGQPGCGVATPGVCSFATVVHPDRRANVELSFDPPTDGGNVVIMGDSDRQEDDWRACMIGYFLQGSLPFGYVRSSVSRLWTTLG
ncbi:hypothetical protein Dimus_036450 [Dionaea muscipula]